MTADQDRQEDRMSIEERIATANRILTRGHYSIKDWTWLRDERDRLIRELQHQ